MKALSHGSAGYKRGCRCDVCRGYNGLKMARLRAGRQIVRTYGTPGIACRCGDRLVPCDGLWTDWKHVGSGREACPDGEWASPADPEWRKVPVG